MPLDFRLEIPPLITAACAGLVVLFVIFLVRMLSESRSVRRDIRLLQALIRQFPPLTPETRHTGLQLNTVETVRSSSAGQPRTVRRLWNEVEYPSSPTAERARRLDGSRFVPQRNFSLKTWSSTAAIIRRSTRPFHPSLRRWD